MLLRNIPQILRVSRLRLGWEERSVTREKDLEGHGPVAVPLLNPAQAARHTGHRDLPTSHNDNGQHGQGYTDEHKADEHKAVDANGDASDGDAVATRRAG